MPSASPNISLTALVAVSCLALTAHARYILSDSFQGASFFDTFDFFTASDPTDGFVQYVDSKTAIKNELIGLVGGSQTDSSVYLGVDFKSVTTTGRQSVRIQSQQAWTHGLLVADIQASPSGCGSWPALWMLSHNPVWPGENGEIDILEGVNNQVTNAFTLHTSAGCAVRNDSSTFSGTMSTVDCDVNDPVQPKNAGCSITAPVNDTIKMNGQVRAHSTAGPKFNTQGGGVYAMLWEADALTFWFYPRGTVPADLAAGSSPDPSSWSQKPVAKFQGCEFDAHLSNLSIVINQSFCGKQNWPDQVYNTGGCAAQTGVSDCTSFVGQRPGAFANAYWLINSIKMYQETADASSSKTKRDGTPGFSLLDIPVIDISERSLPYVEKRHVPRIIEQAQTSGAVVGVHAGLEQDRRAGVTRALVIVGFLTSVFFVAML
ncbi:hypothetical protein AAFC00_004143 [Neodothiora populina]|uniref:GH16 domain-containing protein n=1 Tax=Neodothiora populina TaxID=2781224 RepID=A0ABR3PIP5_9PEZI